MISRKHAWRSIGAPVAAFGFVGAIAQTPPDSTASDKLDFRFEGRVGAETSSNLAIEEIDSNAGDGDVALTVEALLEATYSPTDRTTLRAGYEGSQSFHEEFQAFDLGLHRGYAEAAYDFDIATVGVLGNLAHARLDGEGFLDYTQISPYVSKQFGDAVFLRGSYAYTEKDFAGRPQRDATSGKAALDAYMFLDGVRRYVVVGGSFASEDAVADELDFDSIGGKLRFVQRVNAIDREFVFRVGGSFEDRDYQSPDPQISEVRADQRRTLDLELDAPLVGRFFTELSYKYGDYESNLPAADYDEHVAAVKLGVRY